MAVFERLTTLWQQSMKQSGLSQEAATAAVGREARPGSLIRRILRGNAKYLEVLSLYLDCTVLIDSITLPTENLSKDKPGRGLSMKIKEELYNRGLTQTDFASYAHKSGGMISMWLASDCNPRRTVVTLGYLAYLFAGAGRSLTLDFSDQLVEADESTIDTSQGRLNHSHPVAKDADAGLALDCGLIRASEPVTTQAPFDVWMEQTMDKLRGFTETDAASCLPRKRALEAFANLKERLKNIDPSKLAANVELFEALGSDPVVRFWKEIIDRALREAAS